MVMKNVKMTDTSLERHVKKQPFTLVLSTVEC